MKVKCFGVNPKKAEKVRKSLMDLDLIDDHYPVTRDDEQVMIPVKDRATPEDLQGIGARIEVVHVELNPRIRRPRSFKEILDLEDGLMDLVPSSYDIIGDIALIKLPDELWQYRSRIGDSLRDFNRNLRTVVLDRGVEGEFRIRDLEVISGKDDLETVHVENNLRFKLDPSLVYFSPRLATERMRIADLVEGEKVLDMFAGVGPFSLTIARHGNAEHVIGIDLNPDSIRYFSKNITLNSLDDKVEAHLGDAREICVIFAPFDRVIMNLPHSSMEFLDTALELMESGHIHLYRIVNDGEMMEEVGRIIQVAKDMSKDVSIVGTREVHNYSPGSSIMVFDIRVG